MRRRRINATIALLALALVAGACGGNSVGSTTTSSSGDTAVVIPRVGQDLVAEQVESVSIPPAGGAVMVAVVAADGTVVSATKGGDPSGNPPTPDSAIRIASITKVFTAVATLSLVEDGLVDLDTAAIEYVSRVPVPDDVTVRDLLQHTSGIPDFAGDFSIWATWLEDPSRTWRPEETVALVTGRDPLFPAGSEWHWSYSSTNYVALGVLIEEVTGQPFDDVLRERIIEPVGMSSTYLAGYEDGPGVFGAYVSLTGNEPAQPIDFEFTSISTSAWASGGLVSTAHDLHMFFTALFGGLIVSDDALRQMTESPREGVLSGLGNESGYGLGIQVWTRFGGRRVEGFFGHEGGVPGYETLVAHAPATGMTAFWVATSNLVDLSPAFRLIGQRVSGIE